MYDLRQHLAEAATQPIDWYTLIAIIIAALATSITALIWRESIKQRRSEEGFRRAYLGQVDESGTLKKIDGKDQFRLEIPLKNFGRNPADRVEITFLLFNSARLEDLKGPDMQVHSVFSNIIPPSGIARTTTEHFWLGLITDFLIARARYRDAILNRNFEEIFSWEIKDDVLEETDLATREKLMQMAEKTSWQLPVQTVPDSQSQE